MPEYTDQMTKLFQSSKQTLLDVDAFTDFSLNRSRRTSPGTSRQSSRKPQHPPQESIVLSDSEDDDDMKPEAEQKPILLSDTDSEDDVPLAQRMNDNIPLFLRLKKPSPGEACSHLL